MSGLCLVNEAMAEDPGLSLNAAVHRIGPKVNVVPDTLRGWTNQARVDAGLSPGTTTAESAKVKELERKVKELERANEILLAASSFFARELCATRRRVDRGRVRDRPGDHGLLG